MEQPKIEQREDFGHKRFEANLHFRPKSAAISEEDVCWLIRKLDELAKINGWTVNGYYETSFGEVSLNDVQYVLTNRFEYLVREELHLTGKAAESNYEAIWKALGHALEILKDPKTLAKYTGRSE